LEGHQKARIAFGVLPIKGLCVMQCVLEEDSMNNFWSLIALSVLFILLIINLHAGMISAPEFKTKPIQALDDALEQEFLTLNRWGYSVISSPCLVRFGYSHSLSMAINLNNIKLQSVADVEELHSAIYEDIISKLNSIKYIRPFLANFPLSPDSFALSINLSDEKGHHVLPPYFMAIGMTGDSLEFEHYNKDNFMYPTSVIVRKSIRDSEFLRKFYHCHVARKSLQQKIVIPEVSYILKDSPLHEDAVFRFATDVASRNNLHFVDLGPVKSEFWDTTPFEFILYGIKRLQKDEARALGAKCARDFLKFVQNDQKTLEYMEKRSKNPRMKDTATFPDPKHIAFRISLWDENIDRQPEPYIADILFCDGKFRYFTSDEGQRLMLAFEESFEESQAFLKSHLDS
jgi:hypothetical protein